MEQDDKPIGQIERGLLEHLHNAALWGAHDHGWRKGFARGREHAAENRELLWGLYGLLLGVVLMWLAFPAALQALLVCK